MSGPQIFFCPTCKQMGSDTKLGIFDNDVIRIKRKDMYVEFQGTGIVRIVCWKCGARIEEMTDDYLGYLNFIKNQSMVEGNRTPRQNKQPAEVTTGGPKRSEQNGRDFGKRR